MDKSTLKETRRKLVKWTELNKKIQFALEDKKILFYINSKKRATLTPFSDCYVFIDLPSGPVGYA